MTMAAAVLISFIFLALVAKKSSEPVRVKTRSFR